MSALPPPGPPLLASAIITRTSPLSQPQKPAAARRGKASDRAPTCSGTTATATPSSSGTSTPKTRAMRKATNICGQGARRRAACRRRRCARHRAAHRARRAPARASSEHADEVAADDLGVARCHPCGQRTRADAARAGVVGDRPGGDVGDGVRGDVGRAHRRSGTLPVRRRAVRNHPPLRSPATQAAACRRSLALAHSHRRVDTRTSRSAHRTATSRR